MLIPCLSCVQSGAYQKGGADPKAKAGRKGRMSEKAEDELLLKVCAPAPLPFPCPLGHAHRALLADWGAECGGNVFACTLGHDLRVKGRREWASGARRVSEGKSHETRKQKLTCQKQRPQRAEKEADAQEEALDDERLAKQPSVLQNGTLREYQLEGLNWLIKLYNNGISGILADEMGLGKTVQTVAMIGYLTEFKNAPGPHMVLAPKSTMSNWMKEFRKWLPDHKVHYIGGSKEEREEQLRTLVQPGSFDVIVTSFEVLCREKNHFKKFAWRYFVIDEAHRIKNENSLLSNVVRELKTHSRLLLTGTPLQNNLHELWALLNFLLPDEFADADDFDAFFQSSEKAEEVTGKLFKILRPFLLRRLKADVEKGLPSKTEINMYLPMSKMQKTLYR